MSQIKVTDILAAELKFNFDYERIRQEMIALKSHWMYTPPHKYHIDAGLEGKVFKVATEEMYNQIDVLEQGRIIKKELRGQYIFYLRKHKADTENDTRFTYTKNLPTEGWEWIKDYTTLMPYTIQCIESLPYTSIGCIRVFVTENTFFPTHRDSNVGKPLVVSTDYARCLGISIIPDTGNVPMSVQSFKDNQVHRMNGNALLFNDSAPHGVEFTKGTRITIRVFGEMDFQNLEPFVVRESIHY